ncbi:MAG: HNH endonuclease signature motif containing protein [Anaerolineae bacterium]|jgi:hypothetical protein
MNPRYTSVARRAFHRCEYCHAPELVFNFRFEVEHVIPAAHGGEDNDANLALACRSCNLHKGTDVTGVDPSSGEVVRLFHPRLDHWSGHFQVDRVTGRISGITPVGQATVSRLNLNSASQLLARQQWIRLGVFP